jgi:hypothetical protein
MDELMCLTTRPHPISIPILLVTLTLQGIVPDAHDLASLRGLDLVCMVLFELDFSTDDFDSADEVCGPVLSGITRQTRKLLNLLATAGLNLTRQTVPSLANSPFCYLSPHGSIVRIDDPIHSLCRLIC